MKKQYFKVKLINDHDSGLYAGEKATCYLDEYGDLRERDSDCLCEAGYHYEPGSEIPCDKDGYILSAEEGPHCAPVPGYSRTNPSPEALVSNPPPIRDPHV